MSVEVIVIRTTGLEECHRVDPQEIKTVIPRLIRARQCIELAMTDGRVMVLADWAREVAESKQTNFKAASIYHFTQGFADDRPPMPITGDVAIYKDS